MNKTEITTSFFGIPRSFSAASLLKHVALMPLVLALASCGGGSSSSTSTPATTAASTTPVTPNVPGTVSSTLAGFTLLISQNGSGTDGTLSLGGPVDTAHPFFVARGNGRSCATCHSPQEGWSIRPDVLATRFDASAGTDPVFRPVDGANSPLASVGTLAEKRVAYSLLLGRGVIRIGLPIPAGAEFELAAVADPYGYASAKELSLFRRPMPTTNLKFKTSLMWDSRETAVDPSAANCVFGSNPALCFASLDTDLLHQANTAIMGHAEAAQGLTATEQRAIVDFEKGLFTAQLTTSAAGDLTTGGAQGGPLALSQNTFYFGINDIVAGDYKTQAAFNRQAMTMFSAWQPLGQQAVASTATSVAEGSVARGEVLFNTHPLTITGVNGFNDVLGRNAIAGTCTSCHSTPNVGTHSLPRLMNTGIAAGNRRTGDMPLYTLRNISTRQQVDTMDPGLAMQTGKWADIGKMAVPSLRGLESRSPYFHDGSANDLRQVINFYDRQFQMNLSPRETADFIAFMQSL
jgi:hypothetical protein